MVGKNERFELRLEEQTLERIDEWRSKQGDVPSRAEAVRRLLDVGLSRQKKETINITDGEKLLLFMMSDVYKHLKIKGDMEPEFVTNVIGGGHYWALASELPGIFHNHEDSQGNLEFVHDVLTMWECIERSYKNLPQKDKDSLKKHDIDIRKSSFYGFDGNHESELLNIACFLVEDMDKYSFLKKRELNSHRPTIITYKRMLNTYNEIIKTKSNLNLENLISILK